MRLFTGLDLAPHVTANIANFIARAMPEAGIRWTAVENLHITTKFIGEWPESRLDELKSKLPIELARFSVTVAGFGFFPNARAPSTFWAGIEKTRGLVALASATESALEELGIAREKRPYNPHLTLARIPEPAPLERLLTQAPMTFGTFEASAFHLYRSLNSVYTKLATFSLK